MIDPSACGILEWGWGSLQEKFKRAGQSWLRSHHDQEKAYRPHCMSRHWHRKEDSEFVNLKPPDLVSKSNGAVNLVLKKPNWFAWQILNYEWLSIRNPVQMFVLTHIAELSTVVYLVEYVKILLIQGLFFILHFSWIRFNERHRHKESQSHLNMKNDLQFETRTWKMELWHLVTILFKLMLDQLMVCTISCSINMVLNCW